MHVVPYCGGEVISFMTGRAVKKSLKDDMSDAAQKSHD